MGMLASVGHAVATPFKMVGNVIAAPFKLVSNLSQTAAKTVGDLMHFPPQVGNAVKDLVGGTTSSASQFGKGMIGGDANPLVKFMGATPK